MGDPEGLDGALVSRHLRCDISLCFTHLLSEGLSGFRLLSKRLEPTGVGCRVSRIGLLVRDRGQILPARYLEEELSEGVVREGRFVDSIFVFLFIY